MLTNGFDLKTIAFIKKLAPFYVKTFATEL